MSAKNIERQIGVTYVTAHRMLKQIRIAMSNEETEKTFKGIVEVDETYIGGKPRRINNRIGKPLTRIEVNKRGRGITYSSVGDRHVFIKPNLRSALLAFTEAFIENEGEGWDDINYNPDNYSTEEIFEVIEQYCDMMDEGDYLTI